MTCTILLWRPYYYACFIDEEIETQSLSALAQWGAELGFELNPCLCDPKTHALNCHTLQICRIVITISENSLVYSSLTSSVMAYNTLISEYLFNTYYVLDTRPDAKKDPDNYLTCFLFSRRLQCNQGNNKIIDHWKQYSKNMNRPAWVKATAEMCVLWDKEGQESG